KRGVPRDADLVFDVRCLPNPHYDSQLRPLTGRDAPVAAWLAQFGSVEAMIDDIAAFIRKWLPLYMQDTRNYLTVAIGCTGGQHRSVYITDQLARRFAGHSPLLARHRHPLLQEARPSTHRQASGIKKLSHSASAACRPWACWVLRWPCWRAAPRARAATTRTTAPAATFQPTSTPSPMPSRASNGMPRPISGPTKSSACATSPLPRTSPTARKAWLRGMDASSTARRPPTAKPTTCTP